MFSSSVCPKNLGRLRYTEKLLLIFLLYVLFLFQIISFAQVDSSSFIFEGIERNYLVFRPTYYNGTDEIPVVFNLHGYTLNARQQMDYSLMNIVADSEGFIAVYPNAAGPGWNTGVNGSPNINDVGFINVLIDTLRAHYSIDTTRIFSCGFSLGGFMSNRLACELSNRIAAIATISGTMAQSIANTCSPNHYMPELLIHGTADLCVPYNGYLDWLSVQQKLDHWTNFNFCTESDTTLLPDLDTLDGCTGQKISFTHCLDSVSVILYKVINGGHSWPGGDTSKLHLSFSWCPEVGNTNFDINASQEIWNFFKNTTKVNVISPNGGEHWRMGDTADIKWTSLRVDSVKIELSVNNAMSWITISESTPSDGNYEWVVQAPDTSQECKIKISYENDSSIFDASDMTFYIDYPTSVEDDEIPLEYALHQNYPNPFNPSTKISYQLPEVSNVTLKILNILGEEVVTLVNNEYQNSGTHSSLFIVNSTLPSGVYFYQLRAGSFVETKKMILMK